MRRVFRALFIRLEKLVSSKRQSSSGTHPEARPPKEFDMTVLTLADKKKQIRALFGTGVAHGINIALGELDEAALDELLDNGDTARARVIEVVTKTARELSVTNQFADEEVSSNYAYPAEYKGPRSIREQVKMVAEMFGLDAAPTIKWLDENPDMKLPSGAEGWFAVPRWQKLGATYNEAFAVVLKKIAESRKFYNYREGVLGPEYLRQTDRKIQMMEKLAEEQGNPDILIVPAQFGLKYRGCSVRRARVKMPKKTEFGLGAFEVGIMTLVHPERFVRWEQLHVDCAGDEYSPGADGQFGPAPIFLFRGGRLEFYAGWFVSARDHYGSASGAVPQK